VGVLWSLADSLAAPPPPPAPSPPVLQPSSCGTCVLAQEFVNHAVAKERGEGPAMLGRAAMLPQVLGILLHVPAGISGPAVLRLVLGPGRTQHPAP
jgi:hypothetical protein